MNKPVIAIGLDAAEPKLIEQWRAKGHLPNLSQIRQPGIYGRPHSCVNYQSIRAVAMRATILNLTTARIPDHFDGKPLLDRSVTLLQEIN